MSRCARQPSRRWRSTWWCLALVATACTEAPASDAGSSLPDTGSVDDASASPVCAIPEGASESVRLGVPAAGWRCERDPRPLGAPRDVVVAPDGAILLTESSLGRVVRIGASSIEPIAEGLVSPIGLRVLPTGDLLVAEENLGTLARLDRVTGARVEVATGLPAVTYLELGPDGAAYVSSFREVAPTGTGAVLRVDLETGASSVRAEGLNVPEGLFFEGDALRVVEWHSPTAVVGFEAGVTGDGDRLTEGYSEAYGLLSDGDGGWFVGDHAGRVVWERRDGGQVIVVEGLGRPGGIARAPDGTLLVAEFVGHGATGYLVRLTPP